MSGIGTHQGSKSISEQKSLLERSSTRKALRRVRNDSAFLIVHHDTDSRRVRNDSASLIVHRDTDSLISRMTDSLSKLSIIFSFDQELFISKVYEWAFRGSLKETLRQQQDDPEARKRSRAIDRHIVEDSRCLRREYKALLLGDMDGKKEFMKTIMAFRNDYSADELESYRLTIFKNVIDCAKDLITAMRHFEIHPEQELNRAYCDFLLEYSIDTDFKKPLEAKVSEAISSIWQDPCIPKILEHSSEFYITESAP